MPLYRNVETGIEQVLAEDAAKLFGDQFELVGEAEEVIRAREIEEARANKVEIDDWQVDPGQPELDSDTADNTSADDTEEN